MDNLAETVDNSRKPVDNPVDNFLHPNGNRGVVGAVYKRNERCCVALANYTSLHLSFRTVPFRVCNYPLCVV